MSGGVDSSAAAYLLQKRGYEVTGMTIMLWQGDEKSRAVSEASARDAARIASKLGIEHRTVDFGSLFTEKIIGNFVSEYISGRTPNPCILCNRYLKWGALLMLADEMGIPFIATGHYAKAGQLENGRWTVFCSDSAAKDQAYVLYRLTQEQLARTIFPLSEYTDKEEIRALAKQIDPQIAVKKDSQDICFVPDNDHAAFLARNYGALLPGAGNFVDREGRVLGPHNGIVNYTIGQRKGLGLAMGHPVFVTEIRPEKNEVVIGESEDLFSACVQADDLCFMGISEEMLLSRTEGLPAFAKIRYGHKGAPCRIFLKENGKLEAVFDTPQRAAAKGQSLVVYNEAGNYILCGGIIC